MENLDKIIEKIENLKREKKVDLSTEEDLAIAVMNLISLEEHYFFTAKKTGKDEYYRLLDETREMRKTLLAKLITDTEGESWCISKHLLAASMRLMEVGTKKQTDKKNDEAGYFFDLAYRLFNTFWGIRLNILEFRDLKQDTLSNKAAHNLEKEDKPMTYEELLAEMVDCCKE